MRAGSVLKEYDQGWFATIELPVGASEAVALKNNLRIALMCTIAGPENFILEDFSTEATLSKPVEIHWRVRRLPVIIDRLLVFDKRSGRILVTLGDSRSTRP